MGFISQKTGITLNYLIKKTMKYLEIILNYANNV